jgi:hypothetical protein
MKTLVVQRAVDHELEEVVVAARSTRAPLGHKHERARVMGWLGTSIRRNDELVVYIRLDTRETVVWAAKAGGYLWHATADGIHAVCNPRYIVDLDHDPFPSTVDRADDIMTCVHCQERVAVRKKP